MQGSLLNRLAERAKQVDPVVGMQCTITRYTDRDPGEVVKISPSGKTIEVREMRAIRLDDNGMSECQEYRYESNPEGKLHTFRLTKKGWRDKSRNGLVLGLASKYHDYSF